MHNADAAADGGRLSRGFRKSGDGCEACLGVAFKDRSRARPVVVVADRVGGAGVLVRVQRLVRVGQRALGDHVLGVEEVVVLIRAPEGRHDVGPQQSPEQGEGEQEQERRTRPAAREQGWTHRGQIRSRVRV
jgi:hypothetical protein